MLVLTRKIDNKVIFEREKLRLTLNVLSMSELGKEATFSIDTDAVTEAMIKAANGAS